MINIIVCAEKPFPLLEPYCHKLSQSARRDNELSRNHTLSLGICGKLREKRSFTRLMKSWRARCGAPQTLAQR